MTALRISQGQVSTSAPIQALHPTPESYNSASLINNRPLDNSSRTQVLLRPQQIQNPTAQYATTNPKPSQPLIKGREGLIKPTFQPGLTVQELKELTRLRLEGGNKPAHTNSHILEPQYFPHSSNGELRSVSNSLSRDDLNSIGSAESVSGKAYSNRSSASSPDTSVDSLHSSVSVSGAARYNSRSQNNLQMHAYPPENSVSSIGGFEIHRGIAEQNGDIFEGTDREWCVGGSAEYDVRIGGTSTSTHSWPSSLHTAHSSHSSPSLLSSQLPSQLPPSHFDPHPQRGSVQDPLPTFAKVSGGLSTPADPNYLALINHMQQQNIQTGPPGHYYPNGSFNGSGTSNVSINSLIEEQGANGFGTSLLDSPTKQVYMILLYSVLLIVVVQCTVLYCTVV